MRSQQAPDRRIGLVLGAGGTVGCAYHAGVLYSLYHHTGFDARDATSIVGTSAGAFVGALVRSGVSPEGLVELAKRPPEPKPAEPSFFDVVRAFHPPTPLGLWRGVRHQSVRPTLLSMARPGRVDLRPAVEQHVAMGRSEWPAGDLRLCAAATATGRRRVLSAGSHVPLSTAVAASSAVPGIFAPQRVGGEWLVDGGVHSVTNIDVMPFDLVDEVWVVAPMAGDVLRRRMVAPVRRWIEATMRHELESVPVGMPVRIFEPHREASEAMGTDLMATDRSAPTILAGFLEAGDAVLSSAA